MLHMAGMKLKTLYDRMTGEERRALARALKTSVPYLYQIAYGYRQSGPVMAKAIEKATEGAVKRHDLRPDIFDKAS